MCWRQSSRCCYNRAGSHLPFCVGSSPPSFIDWWSMSHFHVTRQIMNTSWPASAADVNSGERGQLVLLMKWLWERSEGPRGCEPSATWLLGLLLSDFCFISPPAHVTLHVCPNSRSVRLSCSSPHFVGATCRLFGSLCNWWLFWFSSLTSGQERGAVLH